MSRAIVIGGREKVPSIQDLVIASDGSYKERNSGHSGDLLNEAADALAGIGQRRVSKALTKLEAEERARGLVRSFLTSYVQGADSA